MDSFPKELEEAATIDGCGDYRLFWSIVLPTLRPGLIVVVIWQFLTSWNEFFLALAVMLNQDIKTLPLVPMQYQGVYFGQPGNLFAILVIITIPLIIFYILVQRYFVQGLLSGAVKA
jgi:raffinose/stachyose/melibiose transport system permease protein